MGNRLFDHGLSDKTKRRYAMFLNGKTIKEITQIDNVAMSPIRKSIRLAKFYYEAYEWNDLRKIRRALKIN